jgi:hypothetical protein
MEQDFVDAPGFRVQDDLMKKMNQQLAHAPQRVEFVLAFTGPGQFVQGSCRVSSNACTRSALLLKCQ